MGVVKDMSHWFPEELRSDFVDGCTDVFADDGGSVEARAGASRRPIRQSSGAGLQPAIHQGAAEDDRRAHRAGDRRTRSTRTATGTDRYGLVWNFTEPFFAIPFLTGFGGWVFEDSTASAKAGSMPPTAGAGARYAAGGRGVASSCRSLPLKHGVTPQNCDYELADSLFKTGRAAMIINGDWSWADYLKTPEIDAAVAVLPIVIATGQPMRTMFSPKGYSLNANTPPEKAEHAMAFVRHMTSDEVQQRIVEKLRMLPARTSMQKNPLFATDPTLQASLAQLKNGRLMPTGTELRAVWDGMRPNYQGLLSGAMTPPRRRRPCSATRCEISK